MACRFQTLTCKIVPAIEDIEDSFEQTFHFISFHVFQATELQSPLAWPLEIFQSWSLIDPSDAVLLLSVGPYFGHRFINDIVRLKISDKYLHPLSHIFPLCCPMAFSCIIIEWSLPLSDVYSSHLILDYF